MGRALSELQKLAKQVSIYGLSSLAGRFLNVLLVPLYTAYFTPEQYGLVSYVYVLIAIITVVVTQGMETAFFYFSRKREKVEEYLTTAFYSVGMLALPVAMICWVFPSYLSKIASLEAANKLIQLGGIIVFFDAISAVAFAYLRFETKAKKFALVRLLGIGTNILLNLLLLIVVPWLCNKGWIFPFELSEPKIEVIFVANLISSALVFWMLKSIWWPRRNAFTFKNWKKMRAYGWPILLIGLAGMINETLDRLLLKERLTTEDPLFDIGVYSAFYKIAIVLSLFNQAFRYAVEPFFFENSEKGSKKNNKELFNVYVILGTFFVVSISFFTPIFAKYLIQGNAYYKHPHALTIVPILLLSNLFLGMYFILSIWYKITNQNKFGLYISLSGAFLTVLLNYIFIPYFGIIAAAFTTMIVYLFMLISAWKFGNRYYPISYNLPKTIFHISFSSIVIFTFYQIFDFQNPLLWFYAFSAMVFYGLIIWYLEGKNILIALSKNRGH